MTDQQQYRVIADRETLRGFLMNDPDVMKHMPDSAIERVLARAWRIESPVPPEPCLSTAHHVGHEWGAHKDQPGTGYWCRGFDASDEHPSLPTREQIAEARDAAWQQRWDERVPLVGPLLADEHAGFLAGFDAAVALLQKGADREWPAADDGSDLTWRERNGADRG